MNKRKAKRRISNQIAEAIENLMMQSEINDDQFDKKADELFTMYDNSMSRINAVNKIKERADKKEHFKKLNEEVNKGIINVINVD